MDADDLTIVGVYDGYQMRQYVRGINLHKMPEALEDAAMLVTFFGTGFDVPFLRRAFPEMPMPYMHVDLCFLLKKLGYRGGLEESSKHNWVSVALMPQRDFRAGTQCGSGKSTGVAGRPRSKHCWLITPKTCAICLTFCPKATDA